MAASTTLLAKICPPKSAIFRKDLLTGSNKLVNVQSRPAVASRSALTTTEKQVNDVLYSTPLKKTSFDDHVAYTQKRELQHTVKKIKDILARKSREADEVEELIMVDMIQRLGLEHYFCKDIQAILERHYLKCCALEEGGGDDLHKVALRFRLLRQEGYNVSADSFTKFKDKDGKFRKELSGDTKGLMNLFEASRIGIQGEDILDEASKFSWEILETILKNAEEPEATIIGHTLGNPYLRSSPKLMAKSFLHSFEPSLKILHNFKDTNAWTSQLQDLARMDFNIAQVTHQSEINEVHRWWKKLNLTKEFKLARDQPVKWHIWSLAALPNPTMKEERIELTKAISFIYLVDDIFDVYGTLEELTLFTQAVNRWEYAIKGLPHSMRMCLKALQDTTNEISHKIYIKHGWNPQTCLRKTWADLCNAFLVEAQWFASGHLPSTEEYLKNGLLSSGMPVVAMHIFYLLGQGINSESVQLLNSFPDLVSSMATVLRLSDDLGSSKVYLFDLDARFICTQFVR
uniref:S-linalool synthase n=1 Tax=Opuntia streptacantha TaxID=393608 RepID=A0A7C9CM66_OPUST